MTAGRLAEETITHAIIAAFFEVYNRLGFGFLESVYAEALARELRRRGHRVEREVLVKVWYKGEIVARQRVDMLVDGRVVVEIKAGPALPPTGSRQLYNYLRGTDLEVGLLLFFGPRPKHFREYVPNSRKDRSGVSAVTALIREPLASPRGSGMPIGDAASRNDDLSTPVGEPGSRIDDPSTPVGEAGSRPDGRQRL